MEGYEKHWHQQEKQGVALIRVQPTLMAQINSECKGTAPQNRNLSSRDCWMDAFIDLQLLHSFGINKLVQLRPSLHTPNAQGGKANLPRTCIISIHIQRFPGILQHPVFFYSSGATGGPPSATGGDPRRFSGAPSFFSFTLEVFATSSGSPSRCPRPGPVQRRGSVHNGWTQGGWLSSPG